MISKREFIWSEGMGLLSIISSREEELSSGRRKMEIYSSTGLSLIEYLTEGLLYDTLDAITLPGEGSSDDWLSELPDPGTEDEIQPEGNLLMRFLTEFNTYNPWPWLWLMDLRDDIPEEEWKEARKLFWSRATHFLVILLRPIHDPLLQMGMEGCISRTEEKMKTDDSLRKRLRNIGARRLWELSRAICIELLRCCLSICDALEISTEATAEATKIMSALEDQRKGRSHGRSNVIS